MATSLLAEKSETLAREQRKDPYTSCSIRRGLFHQGAIGFAIHPDSGAESIPPLYEVLAENLALIRVDGASPSKDVIMKIVSFSSAPSLAHFHPLYKSYPSLIAPIAISNLAAYTCGIHGSGFRVGHDNFINIVQRLAVTANPDRLMYFIQKAFDLFYFELKSWFSELGQSHNIPDGYDLKRYIERYGPQLGNPLHYDDKDALNEIRRDLALSDSYGKNAKRPYIPSPDDMPIPDAKHRRLDDKRLLNNKSLTDKPLSDKPKGFYAFNLALLPSDDTGIKVCAFHGTGRPCTRNPCQFSHKIVLTDAQMLAARKPQKL
jgi:hypothetical protein